MKGMVNLPRGVKDLDELPLSRQLEYQMAARSWEWHWKRANYWPWGVTCPYCGGANDECFNCEGTGVLRHEKQIEFHSLTNKFPAFVGGLGSGKTLSGAAQAVREAISQSGSIGIISAPTYKQLHSSTLPEFFKVLQEESLASYNKTEGHIVLTNGSEIWIRSTEDPEPIRGINATWFWYDEGAEGSGMAFDILVGRVRQIGYRHSGWTTTTPRGRNWLWSAYESPETNHEMFRYVTSSSRDNPFLPEDYVHQLEARYVGSFAEQEIEGKFVGFEGLVYKSFNQQTHVIPLYTKLPEFKEIFYIHDWGYTNPMVILVIGMDDDGRLYIVDEFYEKGALIDDVVLARRRLQDKWGQGTGLADPAEPGHIERLNLEGLDTMGAQNALVEGISLVASRLEVQKDDKPRLFVREECANTINEFFQYRYPDTKDERPVVEKPIAMFDHALDCVRYCVLHTDTARGTWNTIDCPELDEIF